MSMHRARSVFLWAIVAIFEIVLITLPVSLQAQLIAGISVVTLMGVIKILNAQGTWRLVSLAFGTAIVMRYVYWRTTRTLPPMNQPENFIPGFLLYLAEMYSVMMLALSLFVVACPLPPRPARRRYQADRLPTVDVFIPSYNEDATSGQYDGCGEGNGLPGRQGERLAPGRRRDLAKAKLPTRWRKAQTLRRSAMRNFKQLCLDLDVNYLTRERNEQRQGRQSQQRAGALHRRPDRRLRRRPCTGARLPDGDGRLFRRGSEAVPGPDAALLLNPDPLERNLRPSRRCRPRTRCSTASSSAASTSGTPRSSAARPRC
jgi:cellulose synthase (UDP-forming)